MQTDFRDGPRHLLGTGQRRQFLDSPDVWKLTHKEQQRADEDSRTLRSDRRPKRGAVAPGRPHDVQGYATTAQHARTTKGADPSNPKGITSLSQKRAAG